MPTDNEKETTWNFPMASGWQATIRILLFPNTGFLLTAFKDICGESIAYAPGLVNRFKGEKSSGVGLDDAVMCR